MLLTWGDYLIPRGHPRGMGETVSTVGLLSGMFGRLLGCVRVAPQLLACLLLGMFGRSLECVRVALQLLAASVGC